MARCRATLAYLVLLRMEVAAFHPRPCDRDSSLWPYSSRRRARELPCIPLCGARTFLCTCVQRLPGRLPGGILSLPEVAGVLVELRALAAPAGVAEHRNRLQIARRSPRRQAAEPGVDDGIRLGA